MTEREKILGRVREALKSRTPHAGTHERMQPATLPPASNSRQWLPPVGNSFQEQIELFRKNAADLKADFYLVSDWLEACGILKKLQEQESWHRIGAHKGELTDAACESLGLPACRTDEPYDVSTLEACDVGISQCDALIAQTGSVLVTGRSAGGRALSVLPPHHVVLARRTQVLPDLLSAFELLEKKYGENYPSFISFITGPSRTGDIERVLVLGAHGPKKLSIICI
jgi:L-lactate dehydrogenase complex protein LldG